MLANLLINFALLSLAMAAPTGDFQAEMHGNAWKYGSGGGVVGFIVLILDVLAILEVLKSSRPTSHKILWSLVIFLFPILGLLIYWLFSNRAAHTGSGSYEAIP